KRFLDTTSGTYFRAESGRDDLILRERPTRDDFMPSGNSVMAQNWLRLFALTGNGDYQMRADRLFVGMDDLIRKDPTSVPHLLSALDFRTDDAKEVVIVTPKTRAEAAPFLDVLAKTFAPNHVLVVATEDNKAALAEHIPGITDKVPIKGQ